MRIDERVLDAIEAMYAAALDETLWHSTLQKLASATNSQAATIWLLRGAGAARLPTFSFIRFDPHLIREYLNGMAEHDPRAQYLVLNSAPAYIPDGLTSLHDRLNIADRDMDRHPYYDWHQRHTEFPSRLISQMSPTTGIQAGVALHRTGGVGRVESGDVDRLAVLHRHIERALALGFQLGSIGSMQQCCAGLLDRNPAGIVLLDSSRRLIYANQAAEGLCAQGDGLSLSNSGLTLAHRQDQDRLRALIGQVTPMHATDSLAGDGVMQVRRLSGKRPYLLLVSPMSNRYPTLTTMRPVASILITDPDTRPRVNHQRLRSAFGLTEAEAQLAAALAAGDDLQSAAERLGIQYATARARLAQIFGKTSTHRQSELLHLISALLTP